MSFILALVCAVGFSLPACADPSELRVATWNAGLSRDGPGLLLRDIERGSDPQISRAMSVIRKIDPDVILLTDFDYDATLQALASFGKPLGYDHFFAFPPNRGIATGLDIDGDGRWGEPEDAQGYGDFAGQGGMAILSRYPIVANGARDFSARLWRDMPGSGTPDRNEHLLNVQRLSTTGHWDVPVLVGDRPLHLLAYYATTPVFDGPEDRNGLRNQDETLFWIHYLDGGLSVKASTDPFVILGDANLDPYDGEGLRSAITRLLGHRRVQDPQPTSTQSAARSAEQGGVNKMQNADPAMDTADWSDERGPGNLRVDYVLPSTELVVTGKGIAWAEPYEGKSTSRDVPEIRHGLVWVDIRW